MAAFLGFIAKKWNALPALVVVPNSTITNWVREFERWAPNLRVVPFYGESKAREVIKKFELFHKNHLPTDTPAKFHVLVTTYENITGRDFGTVFKKQDRWEVLVVDEGQRRELFLFVRAWKSCIDLFDSEERFELVVQEVE